MWSNSSPKSFHRTAQCFYTSRGTPAMPHEIFLTSAELCQLLRCSSTTLWRMRQNPGFPQPRHFGRRLLWLRRDVEHFLTLEA
ncbi:MAG TPA: hypothetical protein DEF44_19200 [Pseudomonas sp.]|uniref:helix-turn-helix transcriptional regulator n=1 Tax=Stutzerimonas kunmingensis TaxID=1211807 RepID=UPI000E9C54EA|nr:hypothetical protein [Pseudomonas sp.]